MTVNTAVNMCLHHAHNRFTVQNNSQISTVSFTLEQVTWFCQLSSIWHLKLLSKLISKLPWYNRGWLYVFVPDRTPQSAAAAEWLFTRSLLNNFSDFFYFWQDWWTWPINYLIRFWSIFVVILTLNFQGKIWNPLYLDPKRSDCLKTKSKHIDWTLCLKCDH